MHARAAVDRWTEEVKLLECEMPAVVRWFEREAMRWSRLCRSRHDHGPGYRAYTSRQFSLYQTLADHAIDVFTGIVGGEDAWDNIWDNPKIAESANEAEVMDVDVA